jgi:SAM-dependent methyltransferase
MTSISEQVRTLDPSDAAALQADVWRQVSEHIDEIAIGSGLGALGRLGIIDLIAREPRIRAGDVVARTGCRAGYLHVILKLLAYRGWLEREGSTGDDMRLRITNERLPSVAASSAKCRIALDAARTWLRSGVCPVETWSELLEYRELDGHLAAPLLARLADVDQLPTPAQLDRDLDLSLVEPDLAGQLAAFLERLGWIEDRRRPRWSLRGTTAALMLPQYWYPLVYLPTLAAVDDLLTGRRVVGTSGSGAESHLDRRLDIRFSGAVFNSTCRRHFFEAVAPRFAPETRPRYLVDIGCGDGRLLAETWSALAELHGREHAPIAIGVDLSRVALDATEQLLRRSGVPPLVFAGDVTRPAEIAATLREAGIECDDCLFVCKSVIHDRDYVPPADAPIDDGEASDLVFVADDGGLIPAALIEQSLVELFVAWRPLIARHGWVVIEAHTLPARAAALHRGQTQVAILDATHGYSRQYLLDAPRFRRAATRAGLTSAFHADIGAGQLGHTVLTVDHFMATSNVGSSPGAS